LDSIDEPSKTHDHDKNIRGVFEQRRQFFETTIMAESYSKAGVSLASGERVVEAAKARHAARCGRRSWAAFVASGALLKISKSYKRPLIVSSTDGVGTKLRVAFMMNRHDTVGIDLVAMNVNDILTLGAEPLAFLDYFGTGKLRPAVAADVLRGIARGCKLAGCSLIGGETAELPSFYAPGEYDLAGFCVGVVAESKVVDGRRIVPGDVIIGLPSNGLHSNGYSLVRRLCFERARLSLRSRPEGLRRPLGEELLRPTRIYVPVIRSLPIERIKGMAHITGGGLLDNLPRVFPDGCDAVIRLGSWPIPSIFQLLLKLGQLDRSEAYRTFNMGIGFALIVGRHHAQTVLAALKKRREKAYIIGEIRRGAGKHPRRAGAGSHFSAGEVLIVAASQARTEAG
jgi:phosphoribosylformylglycinamidine cyclo-ligase